MSEFQTPGDWLYRMIDTIERWQDAGPPYCREKPIAPRLERLKTDMRDLVKALDDAQSAADRVSQAKFQAMWAEIQAQAAKKYAP
jgi:hypothetical protein